MYHIVKSFLPDAEISQKVDPEQELLIEMTAEEEPDLGESRHVIKGSVDLFSLQGG